MKTSSLLPALFLPVLLLVSFGGFAELSQSEARSTYIAALEDLRRGRTTAFKAKQEKLVDYPLFPYLVYRDMQRHISRYTLADLEAFERRFPTLPVTKFLRRNYLENLAKRRAAKRFLAAWPEDSAYLNAGLACYRALALHETGRVAEAYVAAEALWNIGKSQSDQCDPIFLRWRKSDQFTSDHIWGRLQLAVQANQRQLARYLISMLKGSAHDQAEALYDVHMRPRLIKEVSRFTDTSTRGRFTISHGLIRYARNNPKDALNAWNYYKKTYDFTAEEIVFVERALHPRLAKDGQFPQLEFSTQDPELLTDLARAALRESNWSQLERFVDLLPDEERHKPEWQYWLARALEANHGDSERARLTYIALAKERQYYGFLAADRVGLEPQLNDESQPADATILDSLSNVPGVARAIEFIALDDQVSARREWNQLLKDASSQKERRLLGYAALHLGELRLAITTANIAELSNEVTLRFPIAHIEQYRKNSERTNLPLPVLLAVTRQESAFDRKARSSANARGLMQLLPSTARVVAKRMRIAAPSTASLYRPETNVRLGSSYLEWLGKRFNQQLPLMAAGYNAGEHRVDRWIRDADGLAMDVWIERIPFRETRNYVKNVLAFKQVYTRILNLPLAPTLAKHEQAVLPR